MKFALPLGVLFSIACLAPVGRAQADKADQESRKLRESHYVSVGSRAHKQFYPANQWDLSDLPAYQPEQKVTGVIRMGGGDSYLLQGDVMKQWEQGFQKIHPGVTFEYPDEDLKTGRIDVVQKRRFVWDELQAYQNKYHHYPLEIEMATGSYDVPGWHPAFAILVNKDNPITRLNFRQLDGIFGGPRRGGWEGTVWRPEAARGKEGNIRTWGQLGLTGDWKDAEINPYGRPLKYHIQLYFEEKVFHGGSIWNENLREFAHELKDDGTRALSSVTMVGAVGQDRYGIVFADLGSNIPQVKLLPIAEKDGGPYVPMTLETVRSRAYPLFLSVYLYAHRTPGQPLEPKMREFLRYVLSREGQQAIAKDGKWLPLTAEVLRAQRKKLD